MNKLVGKKLLRSVVVASVVIVLFVVATSCILDANWTHSLNARSLLESYNVTHS